MLAFGTLTALGVLAYRRRIWHVMLGLLAYGGVIEILQYFTGYRDAEWGDLLADAIGICVGYAIALALERTPLVRRICVAEDRK